jgi:hypothetical protein
MQCLCNITPQTKRTIRGPIRPSLLPFNVSEGRFWRTARQMMMGGLLRQLKIEPDVAQAPIAAAPFCFLFE